MKMKRITSKCEYVTPAIEVINVVDMDTLLQQVLMCAQEQTLLLSPQLMMIGRNLRANHTSETSCAICPAFKQVLTTEKTNTIL